MLISKLTGQAPCPCCAYAHAQQVLPFAPFRSLTRWVTGLSGSPATVAKPALPAAMRLEGVTVVDPRTGGKQRGMTVSISHGRITDIHPDGTKDHPSGVQVIEAKGKFLVPGYNDMHSHVLELDDPSGSLGLMLAHGVTGFRQMSGSSALLAARRAGMLPIPADQPALLEAPGALITPFNAGSAEAVAEEIRRQKREGADFIKVALVAPDVFFAAIEAANVTGIPILGHLQEGTDALDATAAGFRSVEHLGPGSTVFIACSDEEAELRADSYRREFIKAPPFRIPGLETLVMRRLGKMLINPSAFANPADVERLRRAIGSYSTAKAKDMAARFRDDGSWHCPTLVRLRTQEYADSEEYQNDEMLAYLPPKAVKNWQEVTAKFKALPQEMRKVYREAYPRQLELAGLLGEAGVRMIAGTDGGSFLGPGLSLPQEFKELSLAGFSPLAILQMTTINAAEYLGRTDSMGLVEIGYEADMVLLDADPMDRVENLHSIAGVIRGGHWHSAERLGEMRRRVAETRGLLN